MSAFWPIVFMGTPETSAFTLEYLLRGPDPVIGVVTQPDRPAGRGQKTAFSPVRKIAQGRGLPVLAPDKLRDPGFLESLKSWRPELMVVVAYGRILPTAILELAPQGCINVHYSLLPKYRGAAPAARGGPARVGDPLCTHACVRRDEHRHRLHLLDDLARCLFRRAHPHP